MECGDTASQGRVGIFAVAIGYQCKFDTVVRGVSVFISDDDSIVAGVGFTLVLVLLLVLGFSLVLLVFLTLLVLMVLVWFWC